MLAHLPPLGSHHGLGEGAMKKLLLAGVAALLLLATGTAHANERVRDALPSSLSGVWCYQKFESQEASEDVDIYRRSESIPDCAIVAVHRTVKRCYENDRRW